MLTILTKNVSAAPKQPIKRLPATLALPANATVDDLKALIAKEAKISDLNRIGIYDPTTKKTLKNRKALLSDEPNVFATKEVLVKDLGKPRLSIIPRWRIQRILTK